MSEATRAELMQRARLMFAAEGYDKAPLDALVRSAGLTKGALYHHFGSKQGLFLAVVRDIAGEIGAAASRLLGDAPSRSGFRKACAAYLEAALQPDVRRILLIDAPAVLSPEQAQLLEQEFGVRLLADALRALANAGEIEVEDIEALAHVANGALNGIALWAAQSARPQATIKRGLAMLDTLLGASRDAS
jgi:AcrR family transcriptional regulator